MSMIFNLVSMTKLSSFLVFVVGFPEFPVLFSLDAGVDPGFTPVVNIVNMAPISLNDLNAPPGAKLMKNKKNTLNKLLMKYSKIFFEYQIRKTGLKKWPNLS